MAEVFLGCLLLYIATYMFLFALYYFISNVYRLGVTIAVYGGTLFGLRLFQACHDKKNDFNYYILI